MEHPISHHLSTHRLSWTLIKVHIDSNQCNCIRYVFPRPLFAVHGNRRIPHVSAGVSGPRYLGDSNAAEVTAVSAVHCRTDTQLPGCPVMAVCQRASRLLIRQSPQLNRAPSTAPSTSFISHPRTSRDVLLKPPNIPPHLPRASVFVEQGESRQLE